MNLHEKIIAARKEQLVHSQLEILYRGPQGQKLSSEIAKSLLSHCLLLNKDKIHVCILSLAELTSVPDSMKVAVVMFLNTAVSFRVLRTTYI